jgi:hypothetical protein
MANSDHYPASGKTEQKARPYSGVSKPSDPTNEPGQYPAGDWGNAIFGGPLPTGTGAPGSQGGQTAGLDPTNEIGQNQDTFSGVPDGKIAGTGATGAPGTQGAVDSTGGTAITYTVPNDGIGPYVSTSVGDNVTGFNESTQANDQGYGSGGPQLPGLKGNEPLAGSSRYQPGAGNVMRGGRAVRP